MRKMLMATAIMLLVCVGFASAEGMITANVQVRASRSVYDSVIRAGEDVDMTVSVDGFEPAACQWYFEGEPLQDENRTTMRIDSAEVSDTGMYRMDALDGSGRVRLSVDVALRVVDREIPKTGDNRLPGAAVMSLVAAAAVVLAAAGIRKVAKIQQKHT